MTTRRKIRAALAKAFKAFVKRNPHISRDTVFKFDNRAYYCTLADGGGQVLLSPQPYYRWKEARRAAKRIHPRAFICTGTTMKKLLQVS